MVFRASFPNSSRLVNTRTKTLKFENWYDHFWVRIAFASMLQVVTNEYTYYYSFRQTNFQQSNLWMLKKSFGEKIFQSLEIEIQSEIAWCPIRPNLADCCLPSLRCAGEFNWGGGPVLWKLHVSSTHIPIWQKMAFGLVRIDSAGVSEGRCRWGGCPPPTCFKSS